MYWIAKRREGNITLILLDLPIFTNFEMLHFQ